MCYIYYIHTKYHRLYYVTIVVDYNLILLNVFIIEDIEHPASTRLQSA